MLYFNRTAVISITVIVLTTFTFVLAAPLQTSLAARPTLVGSKPISNRQQHYRPLSSFRLRGLDGPYHTQGNLILGADNQPYLFHGLGRDGLEFRCQGDGHFDAQELSYMGTGNNTVYTTYWGANTVRLPLFEGYWLKGDVARNCTSAQYQAFVKQIVESGCMKKM